MKVKEQICSAIPGEHIPAPPNHKSWKRIERIHNPLERGGDLCFLRHYLCWQPHACQEVEMLLFGSGESERLRHPFQHVS